MAGMQKLDFHEVVTFIKQGAGFENYPRPLGKDVTLGSLPIKYPAHFGDISYGNGPALIDMSKKDIPQDLIDAQNKSFRDALKLYMSPQHVFAHMCSFFRSDFLHSSAFSTASRHTLPHARSQEAKIWGIEAAPDRYSFDFDNPERKSRERTYYTDREMQAVEKVLRTNPAIGTAVSAYQAGFLDYLDALQRQITQDGVLTHKEKERGRKVIQNLLTSWDTPNFLSELLPAICLAYHNRNPDLQADVTDRDFERGFEIAMKFGLFRHNVTAPDGGDRKFICPAHITIGTVATKALDQDPQQTFPAGHMLGMIYRQALKLSLQSHETKQPPVCPLNTSKYQPESFGQKLLRFSRSLRHAHP